MKLALVLLAALPIFGQGIVSWSSNFSTAPDGSISGSSTIRVAAYLPPPVINDPYSGEEVMETVQTLADGTHITRSSMGPQQKVWRDSQGRVRTERTLMVRRDNTAAPVLVDICDPVAGFVYVLDTINRVAHRARVEARPPVVPQRVMTAMPAGGGSGGAGGATARNVPSAPSVEQLGTRVIDGVLCTGTRLTTIIPEGAQGNDRPMTTTNEMWMSQELRLPLLAIYSSPLGGTTTRKYKNFSANDPDPSLFMVPPGYSIVDEKDSFTIRWGEQ